MIKIFKSQTQKIGLIGENLATQYLISKGFTIISRNIQVGRGEIDIFAVKENIYYFFEVKSSGVYSRISPAENITLKKFHIFKKSVYLHCMNKGITNFKIGFILIYLDNNKKLIKIKKFFD